MDVAIRQLASRQDDVVAVWQLVELEWTKDAIEHRTSGFDRLHDGVFITSLAPPTQRQLWRAATLTARDTYLHRLSAAACWGIRPTTASSQTVVRPGNGGPRLAGTLRIHRSTKLTGNTTAHTGIPLTTVPRTLIDLATILNAKEMRKATREALRLGLTTPAEIGHVAALHPNRRGTASLGALVTQYARLGMDRTKSDAEAYALELLDTHSRPLPDGINEPVAGGEADLIWHQHRLIIEIDGPQFHRDKLEDARKTAIWRAAGWDVRRIASDDVFDRPERLLSLVPQ